MTGEGADCFKNTINIRNLEPKNGTLVRTSFGTTNLLTSRFSRFSFLIPSSPQGAVIAASVLLSQSSERLAFATYTRERQ
jgi:hypothetical protein